MPFLMLGALAYLIAAHSDGYSMSSWSERVQSAQMFWSEAGKSIGKLRAGVILALLGCIAFTVIVFATMPPRPVGYAVQDEQGYWLADHGVKIRPMTKEEFRNFGMKRDRPLAVICFDLSLVAAIGFAYGPGSPERST